MSGTVMVLALMELTVYRKVDCNQLIKQLSQMTVVVIITTTGKGEAGSTMRVCRRKNQPLSGAQRRRPSGACNTAVT